MSNDMSTFSNDTKSQTKFLSETEELAEKIKERIKHAEQREKYWKEKFQKSERRWYDLLEQQKRMSASDT